ncbi:hypothetical protein [Azospirillum doebereinerae]
MRGTGAALVLAALAWASAAFAADPAFLPNDPKRPVEAISRDLGIRPEQFVACFNDVRPAPNGSRPTAERVHANKAVLLGCLQRANPAITNDGLDTVMDRYRPGGREAQRPR